MMRSTVQRLANSGTPSVRCLSTPSRDTQAFELPDGRILGFAEYGDPSGRPLLSFHGYPSCRLDAAPYEGMARRLGLRIISIDRPGFGLSSPQPHRRLLDWPADVQVFAKGMHLDRFAVLGVSGGGPYALACAHSLPKGMLTGVGLFASAAPWAAGAHHNTWIRRVTAKMSVGWPRGLESIIAGTVGSLKWLLSTRLVSGMVDNRLEAAERNKHESIGDPEFEASEEWLAGLSVPDQRKLLIRTFLDEPFAQGSHEAAHEAKLLSSKDWGFKLEDIDFDPIRIWHGASDKNSPAVMIRWMAERLQHTKLRIYRADTHYTMFKHMEGALAELVPKEGGGCKTEKN